MNRYDYARFKTEINLTQYAAHLGYEIDRKKTTRSSVVMRNGADKVIISKRANLWMYFSVTDDRDNGTIINFAEKRTGKSIGEIARDLQIWLDGGIKRPVTQNYVRDIKPPEFDHARIQKLFKFCRPIKHHRYLASRGLTDALLSEKRFGGRIYLDRYQNAVFPHYKQGKVCGLELKSKDKALFVRGSEKTLWRSHIFKGDHTLIIGEAVIDALSYHALFKHKHAIYAATGGGLSSKQAEIISAFIAGFENLKHIIIIPDHDEGGDKLEKRIREAVQAAGFTGLLETHKPEREEQDWNDIYLGSGSV